MSKTAVINIRTDNDTKRAIEDLYSAFGISVSDAVNIFLKNRSCKTDYRLLWNCRDIIKKRWPPLPRFKR